MGIYHDTLPPDHKDQEIEKNEIIEEYECLTGNIRMDRMIVPDGDDLYFVAFCRNGYEAEGEYFTSLGAARFRFEILKKKIV